MNIDFQNKKTRFLLIIVFCLLAVTVGAAVFYLQNEKEITILDFTDKTKTDVDAWAEENSLKDSQLKYEYTYDEEKEEDTVLSQSIAAGEQLKEKDTLTVTLSNGYDPNKEITLPDFTGMNQDDITAWFTDNHFMNVTYEYLQDTAIAKDIFIKLSVSGTTAKRSDAIAVTISSGQDTSKDITVPDFTDYTKTNIQAWAKTNSITVTFSSANSNTVSKDKVISQSVKAGTVIKTGSKLSIVMSSGKGIAVTDMSGKTKAQADAWITSNNLKAVYMDVYDGTVATGSVVSQDPSSGTLSEGSKITFKISVGWVGVENYTGKTKSAIASYITWLNTQNSSTAKISISYTETESSEAAGTVIEQALNGTVQTATAYSAPGGKVTVKIAIGKKVTVESKAGTAESDFKTYLTGLGLGAGNITYSYSDSIATGSIVKNDTGTYTAGDSVNYVVSKGQYSPDSSLYQAGKTYSALVSAINAANTLGAGWSVSQTQESSESYDSGVIVSACTVSGKTVSCRVSSGMLVTVPDVRNMTQSAAESKLSSIGLKLSVRTTIYSSTVASGSIIAQYPSSGTKANKNSTVEVTVSKGPEPTAETACPAGSTGTYPSCTCGQGYTYNSTSNSCDQTMVTVPDYNLSVLSNGSSYDAIQLNVQTALSDFYNITYEKLNTEATNPQGKLAIASIDGIDPGGSAWIGTSITVKIYVPW